MLKRYFIKLSYSGKRYCGWQIQPKSPSVQETISKCLDKMFQTNVKLVGCGRTDTGVHASTYFAHVDLNLSIEIQQLVYKLNKMLPNDIAVEAIFLVNDIAHARFDAIERTYNYFIHQVKSPFLFDQSFYYPYPLDIDAMNLAASYLIGNIDFTSFSKLHTDVNNNFCEVFYAKWEYQNNSSLVFKVTANRFLRNMVRALVGTLLDVGRGKIESQDIIAILDAKNRSHAGVSVPPQGLFLSDIKYPYIN